MKLSKRRIDTAPKSDSTYRQTSSDPVAAAGRIWRRVTRRKAVSGPSPSERAVSSSAGSTRSSTAATGRNTYGYDSRVSDQKVGRKPVSSGTFDTKAKAAT